MTFESLQVIYALLERETEKLKRAWKEARKNTRDAKKDERAESVVYALEIKEVDAYEEYIKAFRTWEELKRKTWS